jgi:hypothetical protein
MNRRYPLVAQRAGHRCEYCQAPEALFNLPFEVEHVIPAVRQGTDDASNWALSCRSCNLHKSDHVDGIDPETREFARLFHPRQDRWTDHFRVDAGTGAIVGLSPSGRTTVASLRMNAPTQLAARRLWMRLKLFPA